MHTNCDKVTTSVTFLRLKFLLTTNCATFHRNLLPFLPDPYTYQKPVSGLYNVDLRRREYFTSVKSMDYFVSGINKNHRLTSHCRKHRICILHAPPILHKKDVCLSSGGSCSYGSVRCTRCQRVLPLLSFLSANFMDESR